MENGEQIIISGRAKPKTGLLVLAIIMIICLVVGLVITFKTNRPETINASKLIPEALMGFAIIILFRFYSKSQKSYITVTNRRITGATAWGSTVNLPLNQVTSASMDATGALVISGNIIFAKMDNTPQIYAEINRLLMTR